MTQIVVEEAATRIDRNIIHIVRTVFSEEISIAELMACFKKVGT